jgi:hypothetical protein
MLYLADIGFNLCPPTDTPLPLDFAPSLSAWSGIFNSCHHPGMSHFQLCLESRFSPNERTVTFHFWLHVVALRVLICVDI